MPVRLTSPPGSEPVTLAEAKAQLRLDTAIDDAHVTALITAAREHVEQVCWRGLITQTYELVLDSFRGDDVLELGSRGLGAGPRGLLAGGVPWIELPFGQLQSVSSVQYTDSNGTLLTLDPSGYSVDSVSVPAKLRVAYGKSWPSTRSPQWDAVRITYVVGWTNAAAVPLSIKQALLILIATMYEFRTVEVGNAVLAKVGFSVNNLLDPHRLVRF